VAVSWAKRAWNLKTWPYPIRYAFVATILVPPLVFLGRRALRKPVLVLVRARTETASITLGNTSSYKVWFVRNADVIIDTAKKWKFTGEVTPSDGAHVGFERLGNDTLHIVVTASGTASPGRLFDPGKDTEFVAKSSIQIAMRKEDAINLVFPYSGRARIGGLVGSQTRAGSPLLLDGKVQLVSTTALISHRFIAGSVDLQFGDQVEIAGYDSVPEATGFVRVDDGQGLQVAMDALGTGVRTRRLREADAIVVERPFWAFLSTDPLLAVIILVLSIWGHEFLKSVFYKPLEKWLRGKSATHSSKADD
jgi:hypothetical protein